MPRRQRRSKRRLPTSDGWALWLAGEPIPEDTPANAQARDEWITWEYFATPEEIERQTAMRQPSGVPKRSALP